MSYYCEGVGVVVADNGDVAVGDELMMKMGSFDDENGERNVFDKRKLTSWL